MDQDIRWKQRYANYEKALGQLTKAIEEFDDNPLDIIKEGIIQRFEFTHELAWKVMKDYLEYESIRNMTGSRSATREAFNKGLLKNGQVWMNMIERRNKPSTPITKPFSNRNFPRSQLYTILYFRNLK